MLTEPYFFQDKYGEQSVQKRTRFFSHTFAKDSNQYIDCFIKRNILSDSTSYVQYGQYEDRTFYSFEMSQPEHSQWNLFPTTDHPHHKYKFVGLDIRFSQTLSQWDRETYSMLDYLGDLGGLYDSLKVIGSVLVAPVSSFNLSKSLLLSLFKIVDKPKLNSSTR